MTRKESDNYGPEHFSTWLPVKSHSHYNTHPPFYFKYRHKYRMQQKNLEEEQRKLGPLPLPSAASLDAAHGPNFKKVKEAKYDDEVESHRARGDYEQIRDKNPRDRALRTKETCLGDSDSWMPGPSVILVPWRDCDTKSTHSNQSWPANKAVSKSQEMRDSDFLNFGHDDKPDAGHSSGLRERAGPAGEMTSTSDLRAISDDKVKRKSSRTASSTSIAINHKGNNAASNALLAETARQLAEMKIMNEALQLQLKEQKRNETTISPAEKQASIDESIKQSLEKFHVERLEAVKGVHFVRDRNLVFVPTPKGVFDAASSMTLPGTFL